MGRAFAEITFTPSVKAAQSRYGSRQSSGGFEVTTERQDELTEAETDFIQRMDGFFQASVSETGWPYVQFRGGSRGFLKVLDSRTIGYADFRGNIQYISVGNINTDGRVCLILMDQSNPSRLKIWGRARVVDRADNPELVKSLQIAGYAAKVERAIVIEVQAYDWNCPQHITPRFTEDEIRDMTAPLVAELAAFRTAAPLGQRTEQHAELGDGPLKVVIAGIRALTPRVRAYLLKTQDGAPLPVVDPGAHIAFPIRLPDGRAEVRHFSIASDPDDPMQWEIAVQREERGHGGSVFIHTRYAVGWALNCPPPRNGFELQADDRPAVLIAGGIGIAPLRSVAFALDRDDRPFELHYAARSAVDAPYLAELLREFPGKIRTHWSDQGQSGRMNLQAIVASAPAGAVFYVCGPERMLSAFRDLAERTGVSEYRVRMERFSAPGVRLADQAFDVELSRSGRVLKVPVGESILDVLLQAGEHPSYDCKVGTCGTCATRVMQGQPDHRDVVLATSEREQAHLMCICVSRSAAGRLVLDM